MAKKTSTKNKDILKGTNAADVLTVKHTQITVNAGKGNDKVNVNSGSSHKIYGEAGNDTIIVAAKAGSGSKIYGDDAKGKLTGKDTFTINGGKKNYFYGGKGVDTFKINGGSTNYFYGEAGNDVITVGTKAGSGSKIYGDDAKGKLTGNDKFTISGGKKNYFYGGKGADTFNVNGGATNYIYGGVGNDVIVIGKNSTGTAIVKDFSAKSGNKDTVKVVGGAVKNIAVSETNMVVKGGKSATVTLQNAKAKTFTVTDTLGTYAVTGANVKLALGKSYKGTLNAASFLTTADARNNANAITIKGNAKNNSIYGGAGVNTIYGYAGNDTLSGGDGNDAMYGGAGTDTLTGGAGKDTFVYANGEGNDTIKDYAAGQDTLYISSGSISRTALVNNDLVFTVGSGKVTLTGAATKAINLKDSRGSYSASGTAITLGSDFTGTMDATKYLGTVKTIDGRSATKAINIIGNAQANIIYAGKDGGAINGGAGDDTLYGGNGKDVFIYNDGNDLIYNYTVSDSIKLVSTSLLGRSVSENDVILELANGGKIMLKDATETDISLVDSTGKTQDIKKPVMSDTGEFIISGVSGDDILYGGNQRDVFIASAGWDVIKNYTAGEDIIQISNKAIFGIQTSEENLILTFPDGHITVEGGASKTISIQDINGSYTVSNIGIELGSDYTGKMDASTFEMVKMIDGRNAVNAINIIGNVQENTIYAGQTGGVYDGGAGDNILYGGDGEDVFVYSSGSGKDVIRNYTAGQDTIKIANKDISETSLSGNNVVFIIGNNIYSPNSNGRLTVEKGADKAISLAGIHGSYTVSNTEINLGSDYRGTMDSGIYLASVKTIDGRNTMSSVNIVGNSQDNVIYSSKGGGTINGGVGQDSLYGNSGKDILYGDDGYDVLYGDSGNDVLYGGAGSDILYGDDGDDILYGDDGIDELFGGAGNDKLYVGQNGKLHGGTGNDELYGEYDGNIYYYESGHDTIYGYSGQSDNLVIDTKEFDTNEAIITNKEILDEDVKFVFSNGGTVTLKQAAGDTLRLTINGCEFNVKSNWYFGSPDNDIYYGESGETYLYGGLGDDEIHGGKGYILDSGSQAKYLIFGGAGNDKLYSGGGWSDLHGGKGNDYLYSAAVGPIEQRLYGEDGDDTIVVDVGTNTQLNGGFGSDTYIVNLEFPASDLRIYQNLEYGFADGDTDVLELKGINIGDVAYEFCDNLLRINSLTDVDAGAIAVYGWDENPLSSIIFADGYMTKNDINMLKSKS